MKTLYNFIYCKGSLTPAVVWYTVRVGISQADQRAFRFVRSRVAGNTDYWLSRHSKEMAEFKKKISESLFPMVHAAGGNALSLLRQEFIDIIELARRLRRYPAEFLNSSSIPQRNVTLSASLVGLKARKNQTSLTVHVKNLSNHDNKNQS